MFFDLPVSSFWAYRSCLETVDNKSWLTFVKTWGGGKSVNLYFCNLQYVWRIFFCSILDRMNRRNGR